jgi:hypothetical protein
MQGGQVCVVRYASLAVVYAGSDDVYVGTGLRTGTGPNFWWGSNFLQCLAVNQLSYLLSTAYLG